MTQVELDYASLGAAGAARAVIVLREGSLATSDPDPAVTNRRDIRLLAVRVDDEEVAEPGGFGGRTPQSVTVGALVHLVTELFPSGDLGVVGVGRTGATALHLAAVLGARVDRLVLVATPMPESPLDRDDAALVLAGVTAKTLIINGQRDPHAAAADADWHRSHLVAARVEMVPSSPDTPDPRLALAQVWERVLSHAAPGSATRG